MDNKNIVIGIEGLVGAGKTSICRKMLDYIPNSILLNGGNLYRSIITVLLKNNINISDLTNKLAGLDIKQIMDKLGIELKIENKETKFYYKGEEISEDELQSEKSSMAVSSVGGITNNESLFVFARNLIDDMKQKFNVIVSGRALMDIYPNMDYHIFITASLEERVKRKMKQYEGEITKEKLTEHIEKRDLLQEKAGFYKISEKTISIDVTECKSVEESTKKVLKSIGMVTA